MQDGVRAIRLCPAAAEAGTPEEAKLRRIEAAPVYLRGRVEGDEALPGVEVRTDFGDVIAMVAGV